MTLEEAHEVVSKEGQPVALYMQAVQVLAREMSRLIRECEAVKSKEAAE